MMTRFEGILFIIIILSSSLSSSLGAIIRNSAVGWWGAYLMEASSSLSLSSSASNPVVAPLVWVSEDVYGKAEVRDSNDLYPSHWVTL